MTTSKQYDYLNRLTEISSTPSAAYTEPATFNYDYNSANQRVQDTLADGSYWVYQYDSLGQVTNGVKYFSDGAPVAGQQFGYQFDTIGNRTQTTSGGDQNGQNLRVADYSANALNQITSRDIPPYVDVIGESYATNVVTVNGQSPYRNAEYFREELPVDNESSAQWTDIVVTASVGGSVTGGVYVAREPEQFEYDADGNLTNDGRWAYVWDGENRLIQMTVNTNVGPQYELKFAYDSKGRRTQKIVLTNGVPEYTNDFLYDGWNLIAAFNSPSSILASYVWGNDLSGTMQGAGGVGGLLEVIDYGVATNFVAYDGNGNVAALVNAANGTLTANYEYGPFGEPIRITGMMGYANPFRFSTKYDDDESDLLYYGYRYYKPNTGTWVSRDPVGEEGGINLYNFVLNAPISLLDKNGDLRYAAQMDVNAERRSDTKAIPCGFIMLNDVFADGSLSDSLQGQYPEIYQDLMTAVDHGGGGISTLNLAKINQGAYLGSGFVMTFTKGPHCCCNTFEWVQKYRFNGTSWKKDYDWTSSSSAFSAADFPGGLYLGTINRNDNWDFDLTLYCVSGGVKLQLYHMTWSSHILIIPGSTPPVMAVLDINM